MKVVFLISVKVVWLVLWRLVGLVNVKFVVYLCGSCVVVVWLVM